MKKKTEEFCKPIKHTNSNTECDNLSQLIFNDDYKNRFIQEYKFAEEEKSNIELKHFLYHEFNSCGENIKNMLEQLLENNKDLLYFKGGIGCGKTRCLRFLLDEVAPKLSFKDSKIETEKPIFFYYDCLFALDPYKKEEIPIIGKKFLDNFFDRIEDEIIRKNFNEETEIKNIWGKIIADEKDLKSTEKRNYAFIQIKKNLSRTEESSAAKNRTEQEKFENRLKFHDELLEDDTNKILYYSALLKHLIITRFKNNNHGLYLILDNIDQEEPPIQEKIIDVARTISDKANIRVICVVRHSTYAYRVRNAFPRTKEVINYIGPEPHHVLINNLDDFLKGEVINKTDEEVSTDQTDTDVVKNIKTLKAGVQKLRETVINHNIFINFFNGICGHNMRRAFLLSRKLLSNSVYNPFIIGKQIEQNQDYYEPIRNTIRAIIIGFESKFNWHEDNIIENIFEIHSSRFESNLIKTRILKIISNKKFAVCKEAQYVLKSFKYDEDLIDQALIEMMNEPKRLIWNDNLIQFKEGDMKNHPNSKFYLTATGNGYLKVLFREINYIEEMLLDTETEEDDIKKDFSYNVKISEDKYDIFNFFDRIELIKKFCRILLKEDLNETGLFLQTNSPETYYKIFKTKNLLTHELFLGVRNSLNNIFDSRQRNSYPQVNEKLQNFKEKTLLDLENWINISNDGLKSAILIKEGKLTFK